MVEKTTFRVSVRDLVAAACKPQHLARGFSGRNRAMEGIREHARIQNLWPDNWEREVPVSLTIERQGVCLEIFGRMDGRSVSQGIAAVEEIKSCRRPPKTLAAAPAPRHLSQLKCYGYMTAMELALPSVNLRLTYARNADNSTATHEITLGIEDLEAFFNDLVTDYLALLSTRTAWERIRNPSVARLDFPYPEFRNGQRELAESVYKVVKHGRMLFARAPTGTGKTMATLFPAIKAMGLGHTDKLFYLTAKGPGRTVAQSALKDLSRAGARIKSVTITAKQKTCFTPDTPCDMDTCFFALAYYTKLARTMAHAVDHDFFDQDRIESLAREFEICPFELSLDLALTCDVIICDLNYAFDSRVYLKRFFDRNTRNLTFLMDEAHNLPDRLRSMYSADIEKSWVLDIQRALRDPAPGLARALASVNREMVDLKTRHLEGRDGFRALTGLPESFMESLDEFTSRADLWLDDHRDSPVREAVLDGFYTVNAFLNLSRYFGDHYRFFVDSCDASGMRVRLFCLDPAPVFSGLIKRCSSAVFFSATFFPFSYYAQVLFGISPDGETTEAAPDLIPYTISLPSPFPRENLGLLIHTRIKTTYRQRQTYYREVADTVVRTITARPGNYLVFFPSYAYMDAVMDCIDIEAGNIDFQAQSRGMTEGERHDFLEKFTCESRVTGFAVMGGIFGEGIDLAGDRLIGVIVVGVGLPQVNREQDEIRDYHDACGRDGFFIAYQMPGFSRVLQASGRLIRSSTDRGVILLLDERFVRPDYRGLFPREWSDVETVRDAGALEQFLARFWAGPDNSPHIANAKTKLPKSGNTDTDSKK
ncbi:MAG: ATP-dependent DNA helicase [Desulfobacter sp.]